MNNSSVGCFLCKFNKHDDVIDVTRFINENIGSMPVEYLSLQVFNKLSDRVNTLGVPDSVGVISEHIRSHTLCLVDSPETCWLVL
jgi:hypothetical protein